MKHVTNKLEINGFRINNKELQMLLETSAHLDIVNLNNCKIRINDKLEFDRSKNFKITQLGLIKSLQESSDVLMNKDELNILVSELNTTQIKNSLKRVRVFSEYMKVHKVQSIFDKKGFTVKVCDHES